MPRKTPSTLTAKVFFHSARSVSSKVLNGPLIPALFTAMSRASKVPSALRTSASLSSAEATSQRRKATPFNSAASAAPADSSMSPTTTLPPQATMDRVMARPRPDDPPVTIATLFSSNISFSPHWLRLDVGCPACAVYRCTALRPGHPLQTWLRHFGRTPEGPARADSLDPKTGAL